MMTRIKAIDTSNKVGETVTVMGWVDRVRDHGGLIFIDLRDRSGFVQIVCNPENQAVYTEAKKAGPEYVVSVTGTVAKRPEFTINKNLPTGEIEIPAEDFKILNISKTTPFPIHDEDKVEDESLRLEYRYLDLRRPEMKTRLELRHQVVDFIRRYMSDAEFWDVETPVLMKGTPEGAREFLVPSRVYKGKFYVLPQSPQQYKQLLMVSGIEKYYQIARCFRDEDQRGDRQPEFTQLDLEMSFIEREDILQTLEDLFTKLVAKVTPNKKLLSSPFTRMTYEEAVTRYGNDKPDLRIGMEIIDFTNLFKDLELQIFKETFAVGGVLKGFVAKRAKWFDKKAFEGLTNQLKELGAKGLLYFEVREGTVKTPIQNQLNEEVFSKVRELSGAEAGDIIFAVSDSNTKVNDYLTALRKEVARRSGLYEEVKDQIAFAWVLDFPLFEYDQENNLSSVHHPFTMPKKEDITFLESDPLRVRSDAYDIVANGYELGSGSIRIHDRQLQFKIFEMLGLKEEEINDRFGHILTAFEYGVPPHGGIAPGIDRLLMVLTNTETIREVMAFPKNQSGKDLMTKAPSEVSEKQLKELGLKLIQ